MRKTHSANIELIKTVANRLGPLLDKVVFLGGAATGLLIIALLDGRPEIIDEIRSSPSELRDYLAETFRAFLKNDKFLESLPGHLPPDPASQGRVSIVKGRVDGITYLLFSPIRSADISPP